MKPDLFISFLLGSAATRTTSMRPMFMRLAMLAVIGGFAAPARAETAKRLEDFEGIEEPEVKCVAATGKFVRDSFVNITDAAKHTTRMTLRYSPEGWDGDRDRSDVTRQRAEVKGLGPHQKTGETFEYGTTWRTDPAFHGTARFCHVFQLKATDGDKEEPLVVLSVLDGASKAALRYCSGDAKSLTTVREFPWKPGEWQTVRIRIKTSKSANGAVLVSVNSDEFQGAKSAAVYRPGATAYRPKWGLYRAISDKLPVGASWAEHKDVSAKKIPRP